MFPDTKEKHISLFPRTQKNQVTTGIPTNTRLFFLCDTLFVTDSNFWQKHDNQSGNTCFSLAIGDCRWLLTGLKSCVTDLNVPKVDEEIDICVVTKSVVVCVNFTAVFFGYVILKPSWADEFKHLLTSPGVNCVTLLPGPDAGEGTIPESHSAGTPPAPLPKALGTPFLYRSPHETLPPSLTCWLKPQPSPPLKTFT